MYFDTVANSITNNCCRDVSGTRRSVPARSTEKEREKLAQQFLKLFLFLFLCPRSSVAAFDWLHKFFAHSPTEAAMLQSLILHHHSGRCLHALACVQKEEELCYAVHCTALPINHHQSSTSFFFKFKNQKKKRVFFSSSFLTCAFRGKSKLKKKGRSLWGIAHHNSALKFDAVQCSAAGSFFFLNW